MKITLSKSEWDLLEQGLKSTMTKKAQFDDLDLNDLETGETEFNELKELNELDSSPKAEHEKEETISFHDLSGIYCEDVPVTIFYNVTKGETEDGIPFSHGGVEIVAITVREDYQVVEDLDKLSYKAGSNLENLISPHEYKNVTDSLSERLNDSNEIPSKDFPSLH
jgi:hypothetical protein